jgi:hypothetical protein
MAGGSRTAAQQLVQPAGDETQGGPAVPSAVHFRPAIPVGHEIVSQAPFAHVTSHLQESRHVTLLHALLPEQLTLHCESVLHVTLSQAPSPMQLIMQVQPSGQVTPPQLSLLEQFIVHVFIASLHVSQSDGQFWTTQ